MLISSPGVELTQPSNYWTKCFGSWQDTPDRIWLNNIKTVPFSSSCGCVSTKRNAADTFCHSATYHRLLHTYPRSNGGGDIYFCASWDCISTGHISWDPPLKVKVSFTAQGKRYRGWQGGATWGGRIYDNSGDEGNIFTIKLIQTPAETPVPIGPNNILTNRREPTPQPTGIPEDNLATPDGHSSFSPQRHPGNPLWEIAKATYHLVNSTNPNLTTACWFCYNIQPPYYEAVGLVSSYNTSSSDKACRWKHGSQTLQSISGKGTCIGKVPTQYKQYCNTTHSLTACTHGHVIHTDGFYILVQVMPRIYFHTEEDIYNTYSGSELIRRKREPISTLTVALLVGLGLTGTGTGIASLAHQYSQYNNLRAAIDEDLERIETSISHLQKSLTSLSEVVLQNRRGLDLLFLQEGGLCVALREECCFYADYSGIVQESMTKLREGLNIRKKEREGQQGWIESWYNVSPWLTTLLSALAGPLILLILICTFGPCLLNRLSTFIRGKLESLETLILDSQNTLKDQKDDSTHQLTPQDHVSLKGLFTMNSEDEDYVTTEQNPSSISLYTPPFAPYEEEGDSYL
uniref:Envelope glycoprotein n=1 Tax=Naja naja TaxID=35670 RepID=A0A8C6VDS9_NAJNA